METLSTILTEQEIADVLSDTTNDETVVDTILPSDEVEEEIFATKEELEIAYKALKESLKTKKEETLDESKELPGKILDDIISKVESNEDFSEEYYAELTSKGYSKEFINTYIEGVKTQKVESFKALISDFGTVEDYAEAVVFAKNNWSESQIVAYNESLNLNNDSVTKTIVSALIKESKGLGEVKPNAPIVQTKLQTKEYATSYTSKADMIRDMNDSRYGKDAGFTKKVEQKLLNSDII